MAGRRLTIGVVDDLAAPIGHDTTHAMTSIVIALAAAIASSRVGHLEPCRSRVHGNAATARPIAHPIRIGIMS